MASRPVRGFGPIEFMLVLAILGGVDALREPPLPVGAEDPSRRQARVDLGNLARAAHIYRTRHRRFPEKLDALLWTPTSGPEGSLVSLPEDPWGRAYVYKREEVFTLRSAGPDGRHGTEDDVGWPNPP